APATLVINVTHVNQQPSFTAGPDQTAPEIGRAPCREGAWATNIAAAPANESGQAVNFVLTGDSNPSLFAVQPTISPAGVLSYTPAAQAFGSASIIVTLRDDGGTANGGVDTSAPATLVINVTHVNQPPSFTAGPDQTAT